MRRPPNDGALYFGPYSSSQALRELIQLLKKRMEEESERLNFEEAGSIYRSIQAIEKTIERQKVTSYRFLDLAIQEERPLRAARTPWPGAPARTSADPW